MTDAELSPTAVQAGWTLVTEDKMRLLVLVDVVGVVPQPLSAELEVGLAERMVKSLAQGGLVKGCVQRRTTKAWALHPLLILPPAISLKGNTFQPFSTIIHLVLTPSKPQGFGLEKKFFFLECFASYCLPIFALKMFSKSQYLTQI